MQEVFSVGIIVRKILLTMKNSYRIIILIMNLFKSLVLVLFLLSFSSCTSLIKESDKKNTIKTEQETNVVKKYIEFAEILKDKTLKNKDIKNITFFGSRSRGKNLIKSKRYPEIAIGYGNDIYSVLGIKFNSENYNKYCNCKWIKDDFNVELCSIKVHNKDLCVLSFFAQNANIEIDMEISSLDFQKKVRFSDDISDFFVLAIETKRLLIRDKLANSGYYKIENNLYKMLFLLEMTEYFKNSHNNLKTDIMKHKNLNKIFNYIVKEYIKNIDNILLDNKSPRSKDMIIGIEYLNQI